METLDFSDFTREVAAKTGLDHEQSTNAMKMLTGIFKDIFASGAGLALDSMMIVRPSPTSETIPDSILVNRISEKAKCTANLAQVALRGFKFVLMKNVLDAKEVVLSEFGTVKLVQEKPRIARDKVSKQQIILPAKKELKIIPAAPLESVLHGRTLQATPAGEFQSLINRVKLASVLLVIPSRDRFVETLEYHFERAGWRVRWTAKVSSAAKLLDSTDTYLCIIDDQSENSQTLLKSIKARRESSLIPVVNMYYSKADRKRIDALVVAADEEISQPFEVKKLLDICEAELERSAEEEVIFEQEIALRMPTVSKSVAKAGELLSELVAVSGLEDEAQVQFNAALKEALGNAASHGNKKDAKKRIDVMYLVDRAKITVVVRDSGEGFDHKQYVSQSAAGEAVDAARERHKGGELGGLGIMLMLRSVDRLEFNEKGTELTLTKFLPKKAR